MSVSPQPASSDRPRVVDIAFWAWLAASVLLVLFGLLLALSPDPLFAFVRGLGALFAVAGVAFGYMAGRMRRGDVRFRNAAVGLAMALVVMMALFALMSRGLLWLLPMILAIVGAVLAMRPSVQQWFDGHSPGEL